MVDLMFVADASPTYGFVTILVSVLSVVVSVGAAILAWIKASKANEHAERANEHAERANEHAERANKYAKRENDLSEEANRISQKTLDKANEVHLFVEPVKHFSGNNRQLKISNHSKFPVKLVKVENKFGDCPGWVDILSTQKIVSVGITIAPKGEEKFEFPIRWRKKSKDVQKENPWNKIVPQKVQLSYEDDSGKRVQWSDGTMTYDDGVLSEPPGKNPTGRHTTTCR